MMVLCGIFLIFSLPFVCSAKEFYVASGVSSSAQPAIETMNYFSPVV